MRTRTGATHEARKALFRKGVQEGRLTVAEIESAIPEGGLTAAERWLLYYSLQAAGVEIVGEEELEGESAEASPPRSEPPGASPGGPRPTFAH